MKLRGLFAVAFAAAALFSSPVLADAPASLTAPTPIYGDTVVLTGSVRSALDGTVFDAMTQQHGSAGPHLGGLFDLDAGGLRVVEQDATAHRYTLAKTDAPGPACAAAGIASPCLVPRSATLAHERLALTDTWLRSLSGGVTIDVHREAPPLVEPSMSRALVGAGSFGLAAIGLGALAAGMRARKRSALGQVREAAREARRATKRDPSLAAVRVRIDELVARAERLDGARVACEKKLAGIDVAALDRKRAAWASAPDADAQQALAWLTEEAAEAERLRADLASSRAGLERIAAALRVLTLRAREHRGTRARIAVDDPVDEMASELRMREEALDEVERAVG